MKSIISMLLIATLLVGTALTSQAQSVKNHRKYEVKTQLTEKTGSYEQRKLYRQFLVEYMNNCPYISHFNIHEVISDSDNHNVVWSYETNDWADITRFYNWITQQLEKSKENGLKTAMTPYQPDYAIGGKIQMQKRKSGSYAKK